MLTIMENRVLAWKGRALHLIRVSLLKEIKYLSLWCCSAVTTRFFFFFFFFLKTYKRIFTVARLHVAQPTYGTCPITCT